MRTREQIYGADVEFHGGLHEKQRVPFPRKYLLQRAAAKSDAARLHNSEFPLRTISFASDEFDHGVGNARARFGRKSKKEDAFGRSRARKNKAAEVLIFRYQNPPITPCPRDDDIIVLSWRHLRNGHNVVSRRPKSNRYTVVATLVR